MILNLAATQWCYQFFKWINMEREIDNKRMRNEGLGENMAEKKKIIGGIFYYHFLSLIYQACYIFESKQRNDRGYTF